MNAIKITNLCKQYKGFALNHINLTVPKGSIMGMIGENGAGKSTTINAILGLISTDDGEIEVLGKQINKELPIEIKQKLGVVLGEDTFPSTMNAPQVGKMMAMSYTNWDAACFEQYLQRFSLPTKKLIKDYSRGMKMKLALAAAFSHKAELLILDEPTNGLDPVVRDEVVDILFDFIQNEEHSILISSHITSDLEKICDYVTFIHQGSILYSEEKDVLLDRLCVVKCSKEQFDSLDKAGIKGVRQGKFGTEVLMERESVPNGLSIDHATLEDIIVFVSKGEQFHESTVL